MVSAADFIRFAALKRTRGLAVRVSRSAFVRNVTVVMTGTVAAQAIGFALSPVISRLYTPADFGVFGSFGAIAGVIAAGATLEYTQAVMLPKSRDDAVNVFLLACLCAASTGALCLLCCAAAPGTMARLLNASGAWVFALLVVATIVSGLNQAFQAWCVRSKAFTHTSASQVVRSVSSNGTQMCAGFLGAGAPGLIGASVLGDGLASASLLRVVAPEVQALRHAVSWTRMKQLAKEYRDFPQFLATTNVLSALSMGLPVLLLTKYYGLAVAGAYAFGERIISAPMGFVTRALRQVLFQRACEIHNEGGRLMPLFVKITAGMFAIAVIPALVLIIWAPALFAWVFGPDWRFAGELARGLVIWLIFMFCNLPSVLFARIIRIQNRTFVFDLATLAGRSTTLVLGGMYLTATRTVLAFALVGAVLNVAFIIVVGRALKAREGGIDWGRVISTAGLE